MTASSSSRPLTADSLRTACAEEGLDAFIAKDALEPLAAYLELLMKWNKVMNLVGPSHWRDVLASLVADSVHLAAFLEELSPLFRDAAPHASNDVAGDVPDDASGTPFEAWDLGAGAGLPGIPLRMLWHKGRYTLVEAREKRALFLRAVLAAAPLQKTFVFKGRAEAFMPSRPPADLIVSRAFMPVEKVLELVADFLAPGGICVFLTLAAAPDAMETPRFSWKIAAQKQYEAAGASRWLWAVRPAHHTTDTREFA